jgi:hypothetical protein
MLGKHSITELHPQPWLFFDLFIFFHLLSLTYLENGGDMGLSQTMNGWARM